MKICSACSKEKKDVFNASLTDSTVLLCGSCYRKTLPICSSCSYRRKPFSYTANNKPVCKICATEVTRNCKSCNTLMAAGTGHFCRHCMNVKTLNKRVKFSQSILSFHFKDLFFQFGEWLAERRGVNYAATHIQNYFPFFLELDKFSIDCGGTPSYRAIVDRFSVAVTRKNLLVTRYLHEVGIISIEQTVKDEYSSLDTIERYLGKFPPESPYFKILIEYFHSLSAKFYSGKTSIRSVRLALTPAVRLLESCQHFKLDAPTHELLFAFLWASPGQRASVTGFINHLNKSYHLGLVVPSKKSIVIKSHNLSKAQLKQRLIDLLREPRKTENYQIQLITTSLAYFHGLFAPRLIYPPSFILKSDSDNNFYVHLAGKMFYIPKLVRQNLF